MEYRRILVRSPNWIGDFVMAQDFFKALKKRFPKSHLAIAVPAEMSELAESLGYDQVIALSFADRKVTTGFRYWKTVIARENYDCAITLAASTSAAILLKIAGIPERLGFGEKTAQWFLTRSLLWKGRASGKHKAQLYRDLMELVGSAPAPIGELIGSAERGRDIVLAPGASISLREWPYFVDLAVALRKKFPESTIRVVGTQAQQMWVGHFASLVDEKVESWVGMTTLAELIQLCREASLVIANDSGVAHLAATIAGVPTVVLFGPGDPKYVAPEGRNVAVARASQVKCSPCESSRCRAPYGYQKCLKDLSVEQVLRQIDSLHKIAG